MSDYLSEEEQLERLQSWWKENGTMLLVGVAVVIGGFVGSRWARSRFPRYRCLDGGNAGFQVWKTFRRSFSFKAAFLGLTFSLPQAVTI